jgi:hypothetical protein
LFIFLRVILLDLLVLYTVAKDNIEVVKEVVEDGITAVLFGGEEIR